MSVKKKATPAKKSEAKKPKYVKGRDTSYQKPTVQTITYEYRLDEVIAKLNVENELLRKQISQYEEPKNPQPFGKLPEKERQSYLNDIAGGYSQQLARMWVNLDALFEVSCRIQMDKIDSTQSNMLEQHDLTTRLTNCNNLFSYHNDGFEQLLTKLQNLV
jgi:hypothetical protein